ncbi:MAG: 2OG-Fe(II) oxygenase, partial [Gammaproteobacteria bacterium]
PRQLLSRVVAEFPGRKPGRFANPQSNLKTGYQLDAIESPFVTSLLYALNSAQFLRFVEALTGVSGLIPDPYYLGGGLHETARGGHLSIHADFNVHDTLGLIRRQNLIVFLNEGWKEEWGGALELWDREMTAAQQSALPVMGRAVVFDTDEWSYHGHPEPTRSPEGVMRRSLALYYYTAPDRPLEAVRKHTTQFKTRPGSADRLDARTALRETLRDLCPPALWRLVTRS